MTMVSTAVTALVAVTAFLSAHPAFSFRAQQATQATNAVAVGSNGQYVLSDGQNISMGNANESQNALQAVGDQVGQIAAEVAQLSEVKPHVASLAAENEMRWHGEDKDRRTELQVVQDNALDTSTVRRSHEPRSPNADQLARAQATGRPLKDIVKLDDAKNDFYRQVVILQSMRKSIRDREATKAEQSRQGCCCTPEMNFGKGDTVIVKEDVVSGSLHVGDRGVVIKKEDVVSVLRPLHIWSAQEEPEERVSHEMLLNAQCELAQLQQKERSCGGWFGECGERPKYQCPRDLVHQPILYCHIPEADKYIGKDISIGAYSQFEINTRGLERPWGDEEGNHVCNNTQFDPELHDSLPNQQLEVWKAGRNVIGALAPEGVWTNVS